MNLIKYQIDKLVYFIAGIIPGLTALLICDLARPGTHQWFFSQPYLTYTTQLSLVLFVAFVLGFSLTTFLRMLLGGLGGVIGKFTKRFYLLQAPSYVAAPWHDTRWRTVLRRHLGSGAPKDTRPIHPDIFEGRKKLIELMPNPQEREMAMFNLNSEKLDAEIEDMKWERWYDQYHQRVLEPDPRDLFFHVGWGLRANFYSAAFVALIASPFVPPLQHWWVWGLTSGWLLLLVAEEYAWFDKRRDQWTTLNAQIKYLSDTQPNQQQALFEVNS
jgi:hypothetical protein